MTAPLARDQYGNPVELPPEAKFWRVRRHTRGRPADIMGTNGEPLYIAITDDQPELRANGCSGSIRLDAVDGDRRALPVQAVYVELGSVDEVPRVAANDGDKELVRAGFEAMTRTMEGMQRAQVERERALAQKEKALTDAQTASQKMIMELMIAVLDRMGGAKDALTVLNQQFAIQRAIEKQTSATRNTELPPPADVAPPREDDGLPPWFKMAMPFLLATAPEFLSGGDATKAETIRRGIGAFTSMFGGGGAAVAAIPMQVTGAPMAPQPPANENDEQPRPLAPKPIRAILALLDDEEANAFAAHLDNLDNAQRAATCKHIEGMATVEECVAWARRLISQAQSTNTPATQATPTTIPGVPPQLGQVLAQLSPEDQVFGLQQLAMLDVGTTEKLMRDLSTVPPEVVLATVRAMIADARRRGPSVAHRAVAAAMRDLEAGRANGAAHRNGPSSNGGAS